MTNRVLLAVVVGGCAAMVSGAITYERSLSFFVVPLSAVLGAAIGWQSAAWTSRRKVRGAIERIEELGGIEHLLDRSGREMLTLWIPLDHSLTEADQRFAKELGNAFSRDVSRMIARFSAVETSSDKVGIMLIGPDADVMLQEIRRYFSSRCPRGSYVTRRRLPRPEESEDFQFDLWPGGKPLFEEEVGDNER